MKIKQLDNQSINKIAAGEVIENPASVVKELVENSLDAGAQHVIVDIETGGRDLIRISDDGCGMGRQDALLCLDRHSTSKLQSADDLFSIDSMGFRGEALASIASISNLKLTTSDGEQGSLISENGGMGRTVSTCQREKGTTTEIRDLFFNVPVRRKFQRSPKYDTSLILRIIEILSLANPGVHFTLTSGNIEIFQTESTENLKARIESVLGPHVPLISVQGTGIKGYVGSPAHTKPNRKGQYLFINRRPIFSSPLYDIVKQGFGTRIQEKRFPVFVLYLELPPHEIDVNVHPQKREIRLKDLEKVGKFVLDAVHTSLRPPPSQKPVFQSIPHTFSRSPLSFSQPREMEPDKELSLELVPKAHVLGCISGYILVEDYPHEEDADFVFVNQSFAHERVLYEELSRKEQNKPLFSESQRLLIPLPLDLPKADAAILEEHQSICYRLGMEVVDRKLVAIANHVKLEDAREYVESLIQEMALSDDTKLARLAKRAALPISERLDSFKANGLIQALLKCNDPIYSPSGNSIAKPFYRESLK